ncbi:MAG: hypothetical protein AB9866_22495 [Syntrophobacteraceae bacterium]
MSDKVGKIYTQPMRTYFQSLLIPLIVVLDDEGKFIQACGPEGPIMDEPVSGTSPSTLVPVSNHWYFFAWNPNQNPATCVQPPPSSYYFHLGMWKSDAPSPNPVSHKPGNKETTYVFWVNHLGYIYRVECASGTMPVQNASTSNPGNPVGDHYRIYALKEKIAPSGCTLICGMWFC